MWRKPRFAELLRRLPNKKLKSETNLVYND